LLEASWLIAHLDVVCHPEVGILGGCARSGWALLVGSGLVFVEAGILQGLSAWAEVQDFSLQLGELKVLMELLGEDSQLSVKKEGSARGSWRVGSR
jgi:hypothetical protein